MHIGLEQPILVVKGVACNLELFENEYETFEIERVSSISSGSQGQGSGKGEGLGK